MSITDDDLETTNSAIAKLEGIEPSGDLGEFNARKLAFGPDKALIGPVAHLAAVLQTDVPFNMVSGIRTARGVQRGFHPRA